MNVPCLGLQASTWLSYTYLFVRMLKNPLVYGIGWEELRVRPAARRSRGYHLHYHLPKPTKLQTLKPLNPKKSCPARSLREVVRLTMLPLMLPHQADPRLAAKRRAFIENAARELERTKMCRFDSNSGQL